MTRVLSELGMSINEAINQSPFYTFVCNILGQHFIDARDDPSIIELCEVKSQNEVKLQIYKYSEEEFKLRSKFQKLRESQIFIDKRNNERDLTT